MAKRKTAAAKKKTRTRTTGKVPSWEEKQKALSAKFKKSRTHKRSGGFEILDVEDGDYIFRIGSCGVKQYKSGAKEGEFYFSTHITLVDKGAGEACGKSAITRYDISEDSVPWDDKLTFLDVLIEYLRSLDLDYIEFEKFEIGDLEDVAKRMSEEKEYYYFTVKTKTSTTINPKTNQPYVNQNFYVKSKLTPDAITKLKLPT